MQRATKPEIIQDKLERMKLGEEISKSEMIKSIYNDNDFYISRSFDVHFSKAKKNIPDMVFKTKKGIIQRTK
jgi:hypothetical protein